MKSIQQEMKEIKKRNSIIKTLEGIVDRENLIKVESDSFDVYNTYIEENPRQNSKNLVKVLDLKGDVLVLKPDITTNIIKQVIPRLLPEDDVKMYYLDKVYRYGKTGSIESTRQFGVEWIGNQNIDSDSQLLELIINILSAFKVDYFIELGNQQWINIILSELSLSRTETLDVKKAIIEKNIDRIQELLINQNQKVIDLLIMSIRVQNDIPAFQEVLKDNTFNPLLPQLLTQMDSINKRLNNNNIEIDLSLLNEFDYYNGPIFKVYINQYKKSVLRGGRYDNLTKEFGVLTKALGFSLDLDKLIEEVNVYE